MVYTFTSSHLVPTLTFLDRKGRKGSFALQVEKLFPSSSWLYEHRAVSGHSGLGLLFPSPTVWQRKHALLHSTPVVLQSGHALESSGDDKWCPGSTQDSDFMVWGAAWLWGFKKSPQVKFNVQPCLRSTALQGFRVTCIFFLLSLLKLPTVRVLDSLTYRQHFPQSSQPGTLFRRHIELQWELVLEKQSNSPKWKGPLVLWILWWQTTKE